MSNRRHLAASVPLMLALAAPWASSESLAARSIQDEQYPGGARTAALDAELPVSPHVIVGELDNGLRYYVRENHEPENRAELRLVVNVGSIVEDDDQLGLAHFLEHMAFNGTEHFEKQELIDFMESIGMRLGPDVNAYTSFDETVYMLQVPTDDSEIVSTAFQIMEDWSRALVLEGEEIDKERGVVIEEWRLGQGAQARLRDQQFPVIFQGSRYAERLPIGTKENLETFDHETLRRFYRDWYRPELMAVVAVGDFDGAEIEGLVKQHFSGLEPVQDARVRQIYEIPAHDETLFSIATDPEMPSTTVVLYHKLPKTEEGTVGAYRQQIVERLYHGVLNQRLRELTQQAEPPFVFASSSRGSFGRSASLYTLGAGVREDGVGQGLEAVLTESERIGRFGVTQTELDRAKANILRGIEQAYTERENRQSRSYASEYIRAFLTGEPIPGIEYEYELYNRFVPEIGLEEVNDVGRELNIDHSRVVVVSAPEKEGLEIPTQDQLMAVMDAVADKEITAYEDTVSDQPLLADVPEGGEIVAESRFDPLDVTEWELSNGVTVVLMPTEHREDQILMRAFSPGGRSLVADEDYPAVRVASTVVGRGGLGEFSAIDLQKVLAGKAASAGASIGRYEEVISGGASPKDLETMFQLTYLSFIAPRADPEAFQAYKAQMKTVLANQDADPGSVYSRELSRIRYGDHPRTRPMTPESVDELDLEASMDLYRERFADASDFTFVFVGKLDAETMRPLVERYLGALPSTGREETWRDLGIRTVRGVVTETVRKGIEPQSQTTILFTGPFEYERQRRTTIRAMAQVLQTRLRDILREDLGGTYGVGVNAGYSWRPENSYSLTIRFGSDPERAEELTGVVFDEIERFKTEGPTETEVHDVREAFRRSHETDSESNNWWISQLAFKYQRGETLDDLLTYLDSVEALTPEMIQEAAITYFDLENYIQVVLLPEEGSAGGALALPRAAWDGHRR